MNKHYGLVGYPLSHSFSEAYFNQKFAAESIPASYRNFELHDLDALREIVAYYQLDGFNVTIPFKALDFHAGVQRMVDLFDQPFGNLSNAVLERHNWPSNAVKKR